LPGRLETSIVAASHHTQCCLTYWLIFFSENPIVSRCHLAPPHGVRLHPIAFSSPFYILVAAAYAAATA